MESADNFYTGSNLSRSLELAQAFVTGGDNFGQIFMEGQGADFLEELRLSGCVYGGSQAFDEGRILFHGRVEGGLHGEDVCVHGQHKGCDCNYSWPMYLGRHPMRVCLIHEARLDVFSISLPHTAWTHTLPVPLHGGVGDAAVVEGR